LNEVHIDPLPPPPPPASLVQVDVHHPQL
jgi:hypothetical protein